MKTSMMIAMGLMLLVQGVGYASAQGLGAASFVGRTEATPGCPSVELHVIRNGDTLSGVAFYTDGSGVSAIHGSVQGDRFSWEHTRISGNGPLGEVTGTVTQAGRLDARLVGTTCTFSTTLPLLPMYGH